MMSSKKPKPTAQIDSLIGQNSEIRGDVVFKGGLHIDGKVKGNVIAEEGGGESILTLSDRGMIEGEVKVPNVVVNGTIIGDVHAMTHIEVATKARVHGNIYYSLIEMAMGAEVNGTLVHKSDKSVVELKTREENKGA
ncbi:MAG: polymer-forming cytoskeletal protein [Gammaproteobacteria bacterium]|nr:polymer-forming cytoskeletal protein [Gammaproteobacteria bacterium]